MPTLISLLRHLSPAVRMEQRRRIEAIANRWADYLRWKHGDSALYRCRLHQIATTKNNSHLRNRIWSMVSQLLRRQ